PATSRRPRSRRSFAATIRGCWSELTRAIVQRVSTASVDVGDERIAEIGRGLVVLVGVGANDRPEDGERLAAKVAGLRIFDDDAGKMSRALTDVAGSVLAVPQFTPYGDTRHGRRPAIDRDRGALAELRASAVSSIPMAEIRTQVGDFTQRLELHDLDGVVMANSLHFVEEKLPVLARVRRYLKSGGRLLLVEYDSDKGNPWVPYPMSFGTWQRVAEDAG